MSKEVSNVDLMSGYEVRLFKGWHKTVADSLKDSKMLEVTLKKALGHEVEETLPSGEKVNVPVIDLLIMKKLGFGLMRLPLGPSGEPKDIDPDTQAEIDKIRKKRKTSNSSIFDDKKDDDNE